MPAQNPQLFYKYKKAEKGEYRTLLLERYAEDPEKKLRARRHINCKEIYLYTYMLGRSRIVEGAGAEGRRKGTIKIIDCSPPPLPLRDTKNAQEILFTEFRGRQHTYRDNIENEKSPNIEFRQTRQ